jgi:hypothetical protein
MHGCGHVAEETTHCMSTIATGVPPAASSLNIADEAARNYEPSSALIAVASAAAVFMASTAWVPPMMLASARGTRN